MKNNNNNTKIKLTKLSICMLIIEIVTMIISTIIMIIGIVRLDVKQFVSGAIVIYIVVAVSLIYQWIPLYSIWNMIKELNNENNVK